MFTPPDKNKDNTTSSNPDNQFINFEVSQFHNKQKIEIKTIPRDDSLVCAIGHLL